MSIGLGKRYWVRMLKYHFGDLDSCLQFMNENKPKNEKEWFELRPLPKVVKGKSYKFSGQTYKVTQVAKGSSVGTVTIVKAKNVKAVSIPAAIKLADRKSYKVTQSGAKAFTGKKIRVVTVGKNVKKLAKFAFCSREITSCSVIIAPCSGHYFRCQRHKPINGDVLMLSDPFHAIVVCHF